MKKTYICPEAKLLCFAACESLAAGEWDPNQIALFANGDANPSQVDVVIPSNPEGGFQD